MLYFPCTINFFSFDMATLCNLIFFYGVMIITDTGAQS